MAPPRQPTPCSERDIARTMLVTTAGFRDGLVIGRQTRPALFDLTVVRPEPLVPSDVVVTANERVESDGEVMAALDDREIARVVDTVARLQPESVAVSLLFSYANDDHERRLEQALSTQLDVPVTRSSTVLAGNRRTSSAMIDRTPSGRVVFRRSSF